jgi:TolB-like protein
VALNPGARLGAYEIVAFIGAGGMGEVYRARDPRLGRDVAVKVLPPGVASDPERLLRFDREARAAAALNHPNILSVYDIGSHDGQPYIISELLDGQTLRAALARGPLPPSNAIDWTNQICQALTAAHDRGIVHRDLKPENLFITRDGRVKVLDFGLAKLTEAAHPPAGETEAETVAAASTPGLVVGTTGYMAPEQITGQPIDPRTDIFALGCVLYEMLSAARAFKRESAIATLTAILHEEPPPLSSLGRDVPAGLDRVVRHCLEKSPLERFQSARDVSFALREQVSGTAAPRRMWMAIAAAAVLAAGAGGWMLWRARDQSPATVGAAPAGPVRLAVLPFENLSRQAGDEWLAGAFADSLTVGLRNSENLVIVNRERVVGVTGSMQAPDASAIQRLSRALAIGMYVSGSYQRVGDDLRVVARLVDANAGTITVQESLTDRFANLLQMEDELARKFAAALQKSPTQLVHAGTSSLAAYRTVAEANDLYLRAQFREAIRRLQVAVQQDDGYPEAWALLGKSYARLLAASMLTSSESPDDILREALRASRRAVELDPQLYEAQLALALSYRGGEQIESWRLAAQKAIELNPRLPEAHTELGASYFATPGWGCARRRDPELAERLLRRGIELDPQSAPPRTALIYHLAWAGRERDALSEADQAVRLIPADVNVLRARATALLWLGRADDLERQLRDVTRIGPRSIQDEWEFAVVDLLRGQHRAAADQFATIVKRPPPALRAVDTARIYAQVGQTSAAITYLERAFSSDPSCVGFVNESPGFARYRADPAVAAVLKRYSAAR